MPASVFSATLRAPSSLSANSGAVVTIMVCIEAILPMPSPSAYIAVARR